MSILRNQVARAFRPLLDPAPYKGAWGGRGSGKSHFYAGNAVTDCVRWPGENGGEGLRFVCIREVQQTLKQSAKRLIEDKIQVMKVSSLFQVWEDRIETPGDGLIIFNGMRDHTAESIKSLEGYKRAWIEEAQTLSDRSLTMLRPTIRDDDAEIWASWNPRRKTDPIDKFLRSKVIPPGSVVVKANWLDNPWFTKRLEMDRAFDEVNDPDGYAHTWNGEYMTVLKGAYYAEGLTTARREGRISPIAVDPHMILRAYWDLGGTGAKADAVSIWIVQFVGLRILVHNYYEVIGQPAATHINWLRNSGYEGITCILPHDGTKHDITIDATYQSTLEGAGFPVEVVKNQGTGAAMLRVTATRKLFPCIWFNEDTTESGRAALGAYHERWDEHRDVGLGPSHDWASNGADAFGLMACHYKAPVSQGWGPNPNANRLNAHAG